MKIPVNQPQKELSQTNTNDNLQKEGKKVIGLSYWALVWRKLKRNRFAMGSFIIILFFYVTMVLFPGLFAPYSPNHRSKNIQAPPQNIHFIDNEGQFHIRPFVYGYQYSRDPRSLKRIYGEDYENRYPLNFIIRGEEYDIFGLWSTNIHFVGVREGEFHPLGTDKQGRDLLSRIIHAGRISLTIGLVGVFISTLMGTLIGIISGYYGGIVDTFIQRGVEILMSFPSIPLWMALAAAIPQEWNIVQTFFAITVLLSLVSWGGLSRQIRGMVFSMKEREFVLAAETIGVPTYSIVFRHFLPNCLSHVIIVATLAIPKMIIGETALSFLGIGMRPPALSWGVLLQAAQNINAIAVMPWLLIPTIPLFIVVLSFNTLGDGIRDAADPYASR